MSAAIISQIFSLESSVTMEALFLEMVVDRLVKLRVVGSAPRVNLVEEILQILSVEMGLSSLK